MLEQTIADRCRQLVQPQGSSWPAGNIVWGAVAGSGAWIERRSVLDGTLMQRTRLLDPYELERLVHAPCGAPLSCAALWSFVERLECALTGLTPLLLETIQHETGFVERDCVELLEGSLSYLREFSQMLAQHEHAADASLGAALPYQLGDAATTQRRQIRLIRSAWGTVAVILPQNAFLLIALTTMLNALATGNRVILRAPQQSARSALLLTAALRAADLPAGSISVVLAGAREFINAVCCSPQPALIHYMGSSQHAPQVVADGFRWGKAVLIDGSGNGWVWVDADVDVDHAAALLTAGALRYNGQTCTSINGALIHPTLYPALRERLIERWSRLSVGNPATTKVDIGPLFDEAQAAWCAEQLHSSGGRILCGGEQRGNLLQPTLVEAPSPNSPLVREGLFGGGMWIAPGVREAFVAQWPQNRYPLCAAVLSAHPDAPWWAAQLPNVARLLFNGDPSIEYLFEPWGGYPGSSLNPVGVWHEKYQRVVSIDEPLPEHAG